MTYDPRQSERRQLFLAFLAAGIAAYALYFPQSDNAFLNDWSYFNSLSLVVRSSVLGYRTFPLHNPWMCGGLDLFANPQNRILSPLTFFDLLLPPQWANLTAMIALSVAGAIGGYRLLRWMGVGRLAAVSGGILWINSSWFGLHLAEGHIPYASMQLLPWVMYLGKRVGSRRHLVTLAVLLAAFLLDGGMYTFIYSALLLLTMLALGMVPAAELKALWRGPKWELGAIAAAFGLLAVPKVYPVVTSMLKHEPWLDFYTMTWPLVEKALFDPRQTVNTAMDYSVYRFHEYGCYLGFVGLALLVMHAVRDLRFWRRSLPYLIGAAILVLGRDGLAGHDQPVVAVPEDPAHQQRARAVAPADLHVSVLRHPGRAGAGHVAPEPAAGRGPGRAAARRVDVRAQLSDERQRARVRTSARRADSQHDHRPDAGVRLDARGLLSLGHGIRVPATSRASRAPRSRRRRARATAVRPIWWIPARARCA